MAGKSLKESVRIGARLFNFERDFPSQDVRAAASQAAEQNLEDRQRDVFESHRHRTFALAFYMTGNELEAEEILQATFVRAFRQNELPDAFGVDSALLAELTKRFSLVAEPLEADASAVFTLSGQNVRRTDLEAAIKDLPPRERILFLLRDVEGYSSENISSLLKISKPDLERSLFSARLRIRQLLALRSASEAA